MKKKLRFTDEKVKIRQGLRMKSTDKFYRDNRRHLRVSDHFVRPSHVRSPVTFHKSIGLSFG